MERYADCRYCKGIGVIKDSVLLTDKECGMCDGMGFSGDSLDEPSGKRAHDDYMQDAINARSDNERKY